MEYLYSDLTQEIIGLAIEVHKELGPGLMENAYKLCLSHELNQAGLKHQTERLCPVFYKGIRIDCGYRIDITVEDKVLIELKSVSEILPIHEAQLLTYLKLSQKRIGLLINFNVKYLKQGIKRMIV